MNVTEETIEATLDADGNVQLARPPQLPPGPVQVTIRVATPTQPIRSIADLIEEIHARQLARGFLGRSGEEIEADREESRREEAERDAMLDAARGIIPKGGS